LPSINNRRNIDLRYKLFPKLFLKKIKTKLLSKLPTIDIDQNVLQQSPFFIRSLTWALITTTGLSITWLFLAYTDEVVMVQGKLEPVGDVKKIQIPEGGVIKDILVENGEEVTKGEILVVLDKEISLQNLNSLQTRLDQKREQLALKNLEKGKTIELFLSKIKNLKEIYEIEKNISNRTEILLKEGAVSEIYHLQQVRKANELASEIIENEKNLQRQELIIEQQIKVISSEISDLKAKNTEALVKLKYKTIKAPLDGIIFDLKPRVSGFVAQSSQPIMKIVPFNKLEADVKIPSSKIGFVRVGMPAEISIDSYPANDFGSLKGEVESIGSDVIENDNSPNQRELFFPASIFLENQNLVLKNGNILPLQVGMTLQANIKLRRVSYLKLLLGTFRDKSESLKRI
jgi:HlyD family secretion protein